MTRRRLELALAVTVVLGWYIGSIFMYLDLLDPAVCCALAP